MSLPDPGQDVFARGAALPRVRQPNSRWTLVLGLGGSVLLGAFVFSSLNHSRQARAQTMPPASAAPRVPVSPPAPVVAPAPAPMAEALPSPVVSAAPAAPATDPAEAEALRAPAVVVDLAEPALAAPAARAQAATRPAPPPTDGLSAEERFAGRVTTSGVDTARAARLRDLTRMAPQGTVISATLETAINSDLPGSVRAVVSRDVRGFDGRAVLIPAGSRLIGQYKSAVALGQTRAFVVWTRILTPDGISIDVASPGADRLGRGGLEGQTDTHFLRRFGAAILLSVVSTGLDAAANRQGNTLIINSPVAANRVAEVALSKEIDIPPTIKVPQGTPLQVFVARDLDFSGVAP